MECRSCIEALTALLDQELTSDETTAVEEHLALCPRCRVELEGLRRTTELGGALPQFDPGPWLWTRIQADIAQPSFPPASLARWGRFLFRPWVPVSALAGVLAVVLAVNYWNTTHPLETEFRTFVQERERLFNEQRGFLFSSDATYRYRQSRNPFIQPAAYLDRNPYQE